MSKRLEKKRNQMARLFKEQKGLCFWCQRKMALTLRPKAIRGVPPPDPLMATIDHLDDRLNPLRGSFRSQERHVVACYECNHRRGCENQENLSKAELWKRSGRYPMEAVRP